MTIILSVILGYILFSFVAMSVLFASYVLLMDRLKNRDFDKYNYRAKIKERENLDLRIAVGLFLVWDTFCNWAILTVWFRDIPRQFTVTSRLKYWRRKYEHIDFNTLKPREQRRLLFSVWICEGYLDRDDIINQGDHC